MGWLTEDAGHLAVLERIKRSSSDWAANNRGRAWLTHAADRLVAAERLSGRPDLAANLEPTDLAYIAACLKAEADAKRGRWLLQAIIYVLLIGVIVGLVGWINQSDIRRQWRWWSVTRPYMLSQVRPYVLTAAKEQALKPGIHSKSAHRGRNASGAMRNAGRRQPHFDAFILITINIFLNSKFNLD